MRAQQFIGRSPGRAQACDRHHGHGEAKRRIARIDGRVRIEAEHADAIAEPCAKQQDPAQLVRLSASLPSLHAAYLSANDSGPKTNP